MFNRYCNNNKFYNYFSSFGASAVSGATFSVALAAGATASAAAAVSVGAAAFVAAAAFAAGAASCSLLFFLSANPSVIAELNKKELFQ